MAQSIGLGIGRRRRPLGLLPVDSTPTIDLDFTDASQPTLDLDFTTQRYAVFSSEPTGDFAGTYKIWS